MNTYTFHNTLIFRSPAHAFNPNFTEVHIKQCLQQQDVQEAIYLASPVLFRESQKWINGELTDKKEIEKLTESVVKYLSRMVSRCTPFGMFAGCYTGKWADENKVIVASKTNTRHTRLDMNYLCALAQALSKHPDLKTQILFYPNTSIHATDDAVRYVDYHYANNRRMHQLSSVDNSIYLQKIIELAAQGAFFNDLVNAIVDDEITTEDATDFVNEIIATQLLVSELEPAVTGPEFIFQLISLLQTKSNLSEPILHIIQVLKEVEQLLIKVDTNIINNPNIYEQIGEKLKPLQIAFNENNLFQTDLFKHTQSATLSNEIKEKLSKTFHFLNKLLPHSENANLKKFKENFSSKYEEKEVALLEVLDPDIGVGYLFKDGDGINHLVDDVPYGGTATTWESEFKWNPLQSFLFEKLKTAHKNNDYTVTLTDTDIENFKNNTAETPLSIQVMFNVVDAATNKISVKYFGGSSAVNLLGRFAHGDEHIHTTINEITAYEQDLLENQVLAEIVHLPESRIGNILLRPVFRKYEIPYLAKAAVAKENQITLDDLYISVKQNRIIIRSKKLNKEILPRLSSAHNFSNNALPIYQFLCDMQTQQTKGGVGFNWGVMANNYNFTPRVEYNNVILETAEWKFNKKEDFKALVDAKPAELMAKTAEFKTKWNLPDIVVLADGDNELLVNFTDEISTQTFVKAIKNRGSFNLSEFLFDPANALVKDDSGKAYTHEAIAILLREKNTKAPIVNTPNTASKKIQLPQATQRTFFMGSEWLYYKIYCGSQAGDKLLAEAIKPLVEDLYEKKLIDNWFFIRYSDTDGKHIRLRFHMADTANIGGIINTVTEYISPYEQNGTIAKTVTDIYNRELERYGSNSIELAERLFCIDSNSTLQILDMLGGNEGEEIRWLMSLRLIDALLDNFKLTTIQKKELLNQLKTSFEMEFGNSKPMKMSLSDKYRAARKKVDDMMNKANDEASELLPLFEIIQQKNAAIEPIAAQILELNQKELLEMELNSLLNSYIHMLMNRLFKAKQRLFELVIYDHLYRYYDSYLARTKKQNVVLQD